MAVASDTRTRILDVAQDLLQVHGANGISYSHISRAVKIRKASIHYHFPTKQKLLEQVVQRYCERFLNAVDAIINSNIAPEEKLRKYIGLFELTLKESPGNKVCLCGILGAEVTSLGNPAARVLNEFYKENGIRLAQILEEGLKSKAFRFEGEAETVGMLIFSMLEGGMLVARTHGGNRFFHKLANQVLKLVSA